MSEFKKLKRNKIRRNMLIFLRSKLGVTVLITLTVSLCIISGTMAWFSSSDYVTNNFEGTHLQAEINETFTAKNNWDPGEEQTKEIRVKNTGEVSAFVRVSLYEFLVNFEVDVKDQTGNGNLKQVPQLIQPELDDNDTDTWETAAKNHSTYTKDSSHYVANTAWVSDPVNRTGMVEYGDEKREELPFKYMQLNYSEKIETQVNLTSKNDYWLYDKGYFYYSRSLDPGETTENLLNSITLSEKIPNKFKGSLYKMKIYMDAHDETQPIIGSWGLSSGDTAYTLINSQLN